MNNNIITRVQFNNPYVKDNPYIKDYIYKRGWAWSNRNKHHLDIKTINYNLIDKELLEFYDYIADLEDE